MNWRKNALLSFNKTLLIVLALAAAGCSASRPEQTGESEAGRAYDIAEQDSSVVAVIGDETITLDAFEARYAQSVGSSAEAADDSLAAYEDFLEKYVDFRLKVRAAEEADLHRSPDVVDEIRTYREQLARPYLVDEEVLDPIVRDLYERRRELIEASHILLRVDPGATPEDTLAAFRRLSAIRDSLLQGADFGEMAVRHSEDPSAQRPEGNAGARGYLGPFSAGRMVEAFEDAAYGTPAGEISPVFRTPFGYHVLRVHDRRSRPQDVLVAHIMLSPGQTPEDTLAQYELAQELKRRLEAGEDFAALAQEYSDDQGTADQGGRLPEFLSYESRIVPEFKEAAFSLEEPGDISDVVRTRFGYHLVKLHERRPESTLQEQYGDLKRAAARLPRTQRAQNELAREIMAERGARVDTAFVLNAFEGVRADSVFNRLVNEDLPAATLEHVFFTIGDSTYTVADMAAGSRQATVTGTTETDEQVQNLLSQFVTDRAIAYEAARLESRNDDFRSMMREFRNGLILFKLMEDSVWTAAAEDTSALQARFEANAPAFQWPERTRVVGFYSRRDSLLRTLADRIGEGESLQDVVTELVADSVRTVRIDTMLVAGPTGSFYDRATELSPGEATDVLQESGSYVLLVNDGMVPAGPKTFAEARPDLVTAYQEELEEELLIELRERYHVRTFPRRLRYAFADAPYGE